MSRRHKLERVAFLVSVLLVLAATYVVASRIEPLLPSEGGRTCFEGRFDGSAGLTFGFPHEKRTEEAHFTHVLLRLDLEPGQEPHRDPTFSYNFDWRYDLRLFAESSNRGDFSSAAQCDWIDDVVGHLEPSLYCFIDCDGGGVELRRAPGRSALDMIWNVDGWLRMSSCGGGGEILRGGATTKTFRLAQAPAEVCKDLPLSN